MIYLSPSGMNAMKHDRFMLTQRYGAMKVDLAMDGGDHPCDDIISLIMILPNRGLRYWWKSNARHIPDAGLQKSFIICVEIIKIPAG